MKTNLKKLTSVCLAVIMLLSVLTVAPFTVGAAETDTKSVGDTYTSGGFEYTVLDDSTAKITGYNGSATELEIPSVIDGYAVTSIDDYAFDYGISLVSVIIPDSIKEIGRSAFSRCENLEKINIPFSVFRIGYGAFDDCTSLKSVTIPDNVICIGDCTFSGCTSLENVSLGIGIKSIGQSSFYGCKSLKNINFPDNLISIGWSAFENCENINHIIIPDNVINIDSYAFCNCTNLIDIKFGKGICDIGSHVFENTAWYDNQPNGVVYVGEYVYGYKGEMPENTSITIEDGTKCIADSAFNHFTNLIDISIPDSVINIGSYAFYDTAWYNNQPNGLVYLGKVVYSYKGEIPENTTLFLEEGTKGIACDAFHYSSLKSIFIPNSVTNIGANAFYGCGIANIEIPDSVTYIGNMAFGECKGLKSISLSNNLTQILSNTFLNCYFLNDIIIPNSVTFIDSESFATCDSLKSITIPDNVTEIGQYAFGYSIFGGGMGVHYVKYSDFTINGYKNTAAETYANENGFTFIPLDEVPTPTFGDVNGDGKVSIDDVTDVQKYIANTLDFTDEQLVLANVDKDDKISIDDVTLIQKHLAGLAVIE